MASNDVATTDMIMATGNLTTFSPFNDTTTTPLFVPRNNPLQTALSYTLTSIIAVIMVGVGCGVDVRELKPHFVKPVGITIGFLCQFFLMPVIAFTLAQIAQMDDLETLALLLVGSCPGGTFSNIATFWAAGDLGLSVTMTLMSNTLGLGMVPLILFIYSFALDSNLQVPFQTIGVALVLLVIPIAIGMFIRYKKPVAAQKILKILASVGSVIVLGVVIAALVSYGSALTITTKQLICAAFFPGIGMALGYGLASLASLAPRFYLKHDQRRAICIETGVQNTQLAGGIIQLSFMYGEIVRMLLFPLAYFVSQLIWISMVVVAYRIYAHKFRSSTDSESSEEDDAEKAHNSIDKGQSNDAYGCEPPTYSESTEEYISKL